MNHFPRGVFDYVLLGKNAFVSLQFYFLDYVELREIFNNIQIHIDQYLQIYLLARFVLLPFNMKYYCSKTPFICPMI